MTASILVLSLALVAQPAAPGKPAEAGAAHGQAAAQPSGAPVEALDWKHDEAPLLTGHVQLTFPEKFVKAGENYFDHETPPRWVIFQAVPVPPEGQTADANYSMYVARLKRGGRDGAGEIVGIDEPVLLSPPGSANTCGWFHPKEPFRVLFGSTLVAPAATDTPGYSKDRNRYSWQFPDEMRVVSRLLRPAYDDTIALVGKKAIVDFSIWPGDAEALKPVVNSPGGYTAECSWSPSGRHIIYTHVDPKTKNPNIWVHDTQRDEEVLLVGEKGYNGGPFFSPDGRSITYRSDRRGDSNLQLYYSTLAFEDASDPERITGLKREVALTDNSQVNWAPYFHPGGKYVIYAASELGHQNYEVFAIELPGREVMGMSGEAAEKAWPAEREKLRKARVTHATGFDGLPAFSADGGLMIFTSQRGKKLEREARPSSQVWVAKYAGAPAWGWTSK